MWLSTNNSTNAPLLIFSTTLPGMVGREVAGEIELGLAGSGWIGCCVQHDTGSTTPAVGVFVNKGSELTTDDGQSPGELLLAPIDPAYNNKLRKEG